MVQTIRIVVIRDVQKNGLGFACRKRNLYHTFVVIVVDRAIFEGNFRRTVVREVHSHGLRYVFILRDTAVVASFTCCRNILIIQEGYATMRRRTLRKGNLRCVRAVIKDNVLCFDILFVLRIGIKSRICAVLTGSKTVRSFRGAERLIRSKGNYLVHIQEQALFFTLRTFCAHAFTASFTYFVIAAYAIAVFVEFVRYFFNCVFVSASRFEPVIIRIITVLRTIGMGMVESRNRYFFRLTANFTSKRFDTVCRFRRLCRLNAVVPSMGDFGDRVVVTASRCIPVVICVFRPFGCKFMCMRKLIDRFLLYVIANGTGVSRDAFQFLGRFTRYNAFAESMIIFIFNVGMTARSCMPVRSFVRRPFFRVYVLVVDRRNRFFYFVTAIDTSINHDALFGFRSCFFYVTFVKFMRRFVFVLVTAGGCVPVIVLIHRPFRRPSMRMGRLELFDRFFLFVAANGTFVRHNALCRFGRLFGHFTVIPRVSSFVCYFQTTFARTSMPVVVRIAFPFGSEFVLVERIVKYTVYFRGNVGYYGTSSGPYHNACQRAQRYESLEFFHKIPPIYFLSIRATITPFPHKGFHRYAYISLLSILALNRALHNASIYFPILYIFRSRISIKVSQTVKKMTRFIKCPLGNKNRIRRLIVS